MREALLTPRGRTGGPTLRRCAPAAARPTARRLEHGRAQQLRQARAEDGRRHGRDAREDGSPRTAPGAAGATAGRADRRSFGAIGLLSVRRRLSCALFLVGRGLRRIRLVALFCVRPFPCPSCWPRDGRRRSRPRRRAVRDRRPHGQRRRQRQRLPGNPWHSRRHWPGPAMANAVSSAATIDLLRISPPMMNGTGTTPLDSKSSRSCMRPAVAPDACAGRSGCRARARRRLDDGLAAAHAFIQRAAASAVSGGLVLNAMAACGAPRCTTLQIASNSSRLFGGSRMPPPITTQS